MRVDNGGPKCYDMVIGALCGGILLGMTIGYVFQPSPEPVTLVRTVEVGVAVPWDSIQCAMLEDWR